MAALSKPTPTVVTTQTNPPPPSADSEPLNVVETPTSPSAALALSRFEFETDKGNEGTKILMVEWDSAAAAGPGGQPDISDWEIAWEGKSHVLTVRDSDTGTRGLKRVFFLVPPGAHIPSLVNIAQKRPGGLVLRTKPLPAIFPATLVGSPGGDVVDAAAGTRGVLHSIWATKRLGELEREIAAEMQRNGESIGLQMAIQERDWIVDYFGVGDAPVASVGNLNALPPSPRSPNPAASPRSPIGGRLGEKLRGLKLATSPVELAAATQASKSRPNTNITPGAADVAVSSFASFRGATPAQTQTPPKSSIDPSDSEVASLDAVVDGSNPPPVDTTEEGLFALPLSPRSPDMKKSPFSLL